MGDTSRGGVRRGTRAAREEALYLSTKGLFGFLVLVAGSAACTATLTTGDDGSDLDSASAAAVATSTSSSDAAPAGAGGAVGATTAALGPIRFSIGKWLDASGSETAQISGSFTSITLDVDETSRAALRDHDFGSAKASLQVDLSSLETGSKPRDVNIEESFFEVPLFTTATVNVSGLTATEVPDVYSAAVTLELHGATHDLFGVLLRVTEDADGFRFTTEGPVSVASDDFLLPVAQLIERCQHFGVDPAAHVTAEVFVGRW